MKFYRCSICGRIEIVKEGENKDLICCGQKMVELKSKSEDAASEKHVPYCKIKDNKIYVGVGEVLHPMTEEHYIVFIAQIANNEIYKVDLKPGDEPKAIFDYLKGSKTYSYCNLHGLWESSEL